MVAIDAAGRLEVWDVTTGKITKTLERPAASTTSFSLRRTEGTWSLPPKTARTPSGTCPAARKSMSIEPPHKKDPSKDEYWWGIIGFSPDGKRFVGSKFGRGTWMWTWPKREILWQDSNELESYSFKDNENARRRPPGITESNSSMRIPAI